MLTTSKSAAAKPKPAIKPAAATEPVPTEPVPTEPAATTDARAFTPSKPAANAAILSPATAPAAVASTTVCENARIAATSILRHIYAD